MPGLWDEAEPWDADEPWDDVGGGGNGGGGGESTFLHNTSNLFPDVLVEFSPSTNPFDLPVWEDITQHLRAFSINRGRSTELDRAEAGVAVFELDNHLGQFDPEKTDGPYYPGIKPVKRVRISALLQALWQPFMVGLSYVGSSDILGSSATSIVMFSGFVESWTQKWTPEPSPGADASMTLQAVDGFKLLAFMQGVASNTGQSGSIVNVILDHGNWPADERNIEFGGRDIRSVSADDSNIFKLGVLQDIDAAEGGLFFVARDGKVTFYNSDHARLHPPAPDQVWGDAPSERQYQSITFESSESAMANLVAVASPYLSSVGFARDPESELQYLQRRLNVSLALVLYSDLQERAFDYLARLARPQRFINRLEVGVRDDVAWSDILAKDLLDRIVVKRRPYSGDPGVTQDSVIQRISISSSSRNHWSVVWTLSAHVSGNLLTFTQSTFEYMVFGPPGPDVQFFGSTSGWVAGTNCSIANGAFGSPVNHGGYALQMTAASTGDMTASTTPNTQMAVTQGKAYSATASFYKVSGGSPCRVEIVWRDSGGSILSSAVGSVVVAGPSYVPSTVLATAPAGAAFATVLLVVTGAVAGQSHLVDTVGFSEGPQPIWTPGIG